MSADAVSVVIPTTGRPELLRAVRSVNNQRPAIDTEIIVVIDASERPAVIDRLPAGAPITVLSTGGGGGGCRARNLGVDHATGRWVAFLDDDDEWDSGKLFLQTAFARTRSNESTWPIVASRVRQQSANNDWAVDGVPARLYDGSTDLSDYLFRGRRSGARRASIFPSSLLVDARLAKAVPWDDGLKRHQDWDWIIRAARHPNASLFQLPDELVTVYLGSPGSISAKPDWSSSLMWAKEHLSGGQPRTYVDFLMAQTLRYSIQARDWAGVKTVVGEIRRTKTVPSVGPAITGVAGVLTRLQLQALMRWIR
ncbi:glycosyltransferase family 2 protein [Nakamurella sp. GG22]